MLATMRNQSESVPSVGWKTPEKQTTVAIAAFHLVQTGDPMSSGSDQSFLQEVAENVADEDEEVNPDEMEEVKGVLLGLGIFTFLGGVLGLLVNLSQPVSGFVAGIFLAGIVSAVVGAAILSDGGVFNNQQQQQAASSSEAKVVCSNCGWRNPKSNNYCHDCGEELNT